MRKPITFVKPEKTGSARRIVLFLVITATLILAFCLSGCASKSQYARGYDRGSSDATKRHYWITQNAQRAEENKSNQTPPLRYYAVPAPEARDGSKQVPSEVYIPVPTNQ